MVKAKKWTFARRFDGMPKESDFRLEEEELPDITDGEVLVESEYASVDPYMRILSRSMQEGSVMVGQFVGRVLESKNSEYAVGSYVVSNDGWRTHTVVRPRTTRGTDLFYNITPMPDIRDLSKSLGIGVLGMPGMTAYFGFLELCQPKPGETVVVNAAAGAVGSLVGQIAKIKGCRVIGYAGSDTKCKWIKEELGFDFAFNYKTTNLDDTLKEAAPNGVDCYFDNVGGKFTSTVLTNMNDFGRISVCGSITGYNKDMPEQVDAPYMTLIGKNLRMEGFTVNRWLDEWPEGIKQMAAWIHQGKIKYQETITEGFENMPKALIAVLRGENIGKAVVKL